MTITARDIQLKQFKVRMRGFDVQEVDFFLDQLAESFTNLEIDNARLAESLKKTRQENEELKEKTEKLKKAYQDVRKNYVSLKDEFGSESRNLLTESQKEADRILSDARLKLDLMNSEIGRLKVQKEQIDDYLKKVADIALSLLDNGNHPKTDQEFSDNRVKHLRQIQP